MSTARKRRGAETQAIAAAWFRENEMPSWGSRFVAQVQLDGASGCWLWTGRPSGKGYAQLRVGDRRPVAHRLMWEYVNGPVPDGLFLDHLCRTRHCVNPSHLEPVTSRENTMRSPVAVASVYASRTHCNNGHEYTEANTLRRGSTRICRTCKNRAQREKYAERKAA